MNLEEIIKILSNRGIFVLLVIFLVPLFSYILRFLHGKFKGSLSPWKYVYSLIVYITCTLGMFSLFILIYSVVFLHANLLNLNVVVYFLPIVSMIVTLSIIKKSVDFNDIPGFDRIYGLLTLIIVTFVVVVIISKLRILIIFGGSITTFIIFCLLIFIFLKLGLKMLFGSKNRKEV